MLTRCPGCKSLALRTVYEFYAEKGGEIRHDYCISKKCSYSHAYVIYKKELNPKLKSIIL